MAHCYESVNRCLSRSALAHERRCIAPKSTHYADRRAAFVQIDNHGFRANNFHAIFQKKHTSFATHSRMWCCTTRTTHRALQKVGSPGDPEHHGQIERGSCRWRFLAVISLIRSEPIAPSIPRARAYRGTSVCCDRTA